MRLLDAAFDSGIRHFDVAPMYGLGLAEAELGRFAQGRRDSISIATKFGIAATSLARGLALVQGPVRRLLAAVPSLRQGIRSRAAGPSSGRAGALLYVGHGYSGPSARASLEASLRALRTDYIDLFLLHDPLPGDIWYEDVFAYLEHARAAGHIRAWGVAGEPGPSLAAAGRFPGSLPVLQVRDDIFSCSLQQVSSDVARAHITFGVLGRALPQLISYVTAYPERRRSWSASVGVDCGDPQSLARLLLQDRLRQNRSGVVLFSTIREEKIRGAAVAANVDPRAPAPTVEAFRTLVCSELHNIRAHTGGHH
jgi:D-threo-aldose 1-dehydrogenase